MFLKRLKKKKTWNLSFYSATHLSETLWPHIFWQKKLKCRCQREIVKRRSRTSNCGKKMRTLLVKLTNIFYVNCRSKGNKREKKIRSLVFETQEEKKLNFMWFLSHVRLHLPGCGFIGRLLLRRRWQRRRRPQLSSPSPPPSPRPPPSPSPPTWPTAPPPTCPPGNSSPPPPSSSPSCSSKTFIPRSISRTEKKKRSHRNPCFPIHFQGPIFPSAAYLLCSGGPSELHHPEPDPRPEGLHSAASRRRRYPHRPLCSVGLLAAIVLGGHRRRWWRNQERPCEEKEDQRGGRRASESSPLSAAAPVHRHICASWGRFFRH